MQKVFLVFGYGVPKNILKDEHYNHYLKTVFNKIYSEVVENKSAKPLIIFCGGPTDMRKPYKRTEAEEMIKYFKALIAKRPFLKSITKRWVLIPEKKSLSSLENLIYSKNILKNRRMKKAAITIFCEQTREKRIIILAKKILKGKKILVTPIDFDVSANRYLSPKFLAKKERAELQHSLWALKSPANLKKHHHLFEEKMKYLRKVGPKGHVRAMQKWWEHQLKELS